MSPTNEKGSNVMGKGESGVSINQIDQISGVSEAWAKASMGVKSNAWRSIVDGEWAN
jgi:hypothetical protein